MVNVVNVDRRHRNSLSLCSRQFIARPLFFFFQPWVSVSVAIVVKANLVPVLFYKTVILFNLLFFV
jgi:hypothetical protein